ncbi:hydrogenase [Nitrogeniibacter mangrovi]|uniref:Hydrogenase expression/formation protein n=1 Tax=Nitrogeniibacter mangrovi TaxID=2016596 RepID=A0A6C1AZW2_9RHOO|nr:hydrogenase [Nitrogeniibacter mangrovi]QID16857.1 hydrogenase [Nitrogeniibacter mangrovi]
MEEILSPDATRFAALLERLAHAHGIETLDPTTVEPFGDAPGDSLTLLVDDVARTPEVWDVAVVLPEALKAVHRPLRAGIADAEASRALSERYGVRRFPAMLFRRDGAYVGAVEGMLDWGYLVAAIERQLAAPASRPPSIGIAVRGPSAGGCH